MKHRENSRTYEADDGKMLVRVSDGKVIGDWICIGDNDDIGNYEEREFTDEQWEQIFKDIGMEDPKKRREKNAHQHELVKKHMSFKLVKKDEKKES